MLIAALVLVLSQNAYAVSAIKAVPKIPHKAAMAGDPLFSIFVLILPSMYVTFIIPMKSHPFRH